MSLEITKGPDINQISQAMINNGVVSFTLKNKKTISVFIFGMKRSYGGQVIEIDVANAIQDINWGREFKLQYDVRSQEGEILIH